MSTVYGSGWGQPWLLPKPDVALVSGCMDGSPSLSRREESLRIHRLQIDGGDEPRFSCAEVGLNPRAPQILGRCVAPQKWRIFMNGEQLKPYSSSWLAG
jgi:hypothetical protein